MSKVEFEKTVTLQLLGELSKYVDSHLQLLLREHREFEEKFGIDSELRSHFDKFTDAWDEFDSVLSEKIAIRRKDVS